MKILVAGFHHETNTFAPLKADMAAFERGGMFPSLRRGEDVLGLSAVNIAMGGFLRAAGRHDFTIIPSLWAGATPAAHVTRDVFEHIAGTIMSDVRTHAPDAVYLDLHGAMVCEHLDDGDGELIGRLREIVGPETPIVASLDLHANVTQAMVDKADALIAYRTYPHEDMAVTGARVADLLARRVQTGQALHSCLRRLPFLIPINSMATDVEPARGIYQRICQLEEAASQPLSLSFTPGFPAADFPECGGALWGYSSDESAVEAAVDALYRMVVDHEADWSVSFLSPDEAVLRAMVLSAAATRPVVIADTQDNPGAGGTSDTTGMLRALLRHRAQDAALGLMVDPVAVQAAQAAGVGGEIDIALGGRSGTPGDTPFQGVFRVEQLSDGRCRFEGPMMHGKWSDVGPTARLRIGGVQIVVSSFVDQMLDRSLFRMAGIVPEEMRILVAKSSVHFRADFEPIAAAVLVAKAPGPVQADPADLPWTNLAPGMRLRPLGPVFWPTRICDR